jgi:peptidoglycan hydrolase-like protein with peptidoglycan-binding domain
MRIVPRKTVLGAAAGIAAVAVAFAAPAAARAATAQPATARLAAVAAHATSAPAAQQAALWWPMVKQGARGERVYAIQYLLNARGARLAVDGWFGWQTTAAVKSFQRAWHLQADGVVGPQTWARLIIEVRQGNRGPAVGAVQHNLRYSYRYSIAVDGQFGPRTTAAVRNFQARYRLGADGIVGPNTWNALIVHES